MRKLEYKPALMIGGGILAAMTSSLCCIGPLVLTLLGVSGAAALARFEFLRVPMIGSIVILFGAAGYGLVRKKRACEPGSPCADSKKYRRMVAAFWIGLVIAAVAVTSPAWLESVFG